MKRITCSVPGALVAASLIILSFVGIAQSAGPAPDAIKIGCTVCLTGRFAANGIEVKDGYEIAVQHINEDGGIFIKEYGKKIPVKLIMYDDESDPTKAAARYEKLFVEDKVIGYLGSFSTVVNTSLIAVAEKNKVPIVVSHFAHLEPHKQGYKYLFSPFNKTTPDFQKIMDSITDISGDKRPKRVAMVMSRTEFPLETAKVYREKIAKDGLYQIVLDETYPLGSTDFSMVITKAKALKAEVWLSIPTPPEAMAQARQMKELDYNPDFINMTQGCSARGWPGKAKDIGEYVVALENWIPGLKWPKNDRLIRDAKKRLGGQLPWCGVGTGYIDVQVLADGIERAGALDRDKIREALSKSDMVTVGGPVKARPDGTFENIVYLCQWQKGEYVPVWPKQYAVAPAVFPVPKWSAR